MGGGGGEFHAQQGFWGKNQADAFELPKEDFDHAVRFWVLGRPTYQVLFGDVRPGVHLTRRMFNMDVCRNLPEDHPAAR